MAGLTQRRTNAVDAALNGSTDASKTTSSNGSHSTPALPENGASDWNGDSKNLSRSSSSNVDSENIPTAANSKGKSLAQRSQIPYSFYVTFGTIISLEYFGGLYTYSTLQSWYHSLSQSAVMMGELFQYSFAVLASPFQRNGNAAGEPTWKDVLFVSTVLLLLIPLFYVFFVAPFRAGFWTGKKTKRHQFHRYMGLSYLIHYVLAWVEFFLFTSTSQTSLLCHVIAVMGVLQGSSAYFSFKVLPELNDPGYYSDKAVLSRTFVQENIFFTVMSVFGSIYYNVNTRTALRSNIGGRLVELIYVFWPFVVIRPWYPITRFSNAGQTYKGRTEKNQKFYEIATLMVKFFYLWAKYFLGFFVNFMVYLDLVKEEHWTLINGMLLLNAGTVSLSIFLHTLRFKKVLPAKLTMSIYLGQIYLTFSAVPTVFQMFREHPKLCALCLTGLLGNATRNRKLHAVWCGVAMYFLTQTDIDW